MWIWTGLAVLCVTGCGGESKAATRLSRKTNLPPDLPAPVQFEPTRNFSAEYEEFQALVADHIDPEAVRETLGRVANAQYEYTTMGGTPMRCWEYKPQGPRADAPFFEAFAEGYPGQSFCVFFEKSWFGWKTVDCGFHQSDVFRQVAAVAGS
jgi:hypothetical protein